MATDFSLKEIVVEFLTKGFPMFLLSLTFFLGGVVLLALRLPGWSLLLGLPAVQIGIVFLIFTFESISRQKSTAISKEYHPVDCLVCGRQTFVPKEVQKKICDDCQVKIAQRLKGVFVGIFLLFAIPMTLSLVRINQDLTRRAVESPITCEAGEWHPPECGCGTWEDGPCPPDSRARQCEGEIFCCQEKDGVWECQPFRD